MGCPIRRLDRSGDRSTASLLTTVHEAVYIEQLRRFAASGGGYIESDTVVSAASLRCCEARRRRNL